MILWKRAGPFSLYIPNILSMFHLSRQNTFAVYALGGELFCVEKYYEKIILPRSSASF